MRLSAVMTINNRSEQVTRAVLSAFLYPGNTCWDEFVIVLDGADSVVTAATHRAIEATIGYEKVKVATIDREPGWLCPSNAFNRGYAVATGDVIFSLSSDFVLLPFSLDITRALFSVRQDFQMHGECRHAGQNYCWYSKCPCGRETRRREQVTWMSPGGLGFCWATSKAALDDVGGYSTEFMDGICYEDDDLVAKLFTAGYPAVYPMDVGGWHIEHPRLQTAMDEPVKRNEEVMRARWGRPDYLRQLLKDAQGQCCQWPGFIPFNASKPPAWTDEQLGDFVQDVGTGADAIFKTKHRDFYPHLYGSEPSRETKHAAIGGNRNG